MSRSMQHFQFQITDLYRVPIYKRPVRRGAHNSRSRQRAQIIHRIRQTIRLSRMNHHRTIVFLANFSESPDMVKMPVSQENQFDDRPPLRHLIPDQLRIASRIDDRRLICRSTAEDIAVNLNTTDYECVDKIWFSFVHSGGYDIARIYLSQPET